MEKSRIRVFVNWINLKKYTIQFNVVKESKTTDNIIASGLHILSGAYFFFSPVELGRYRYTHFDPIWI